MTTRDTSRRLVKICGLPDSASAFAAMRAGADLVGFILAESRRRVDPARVREVRRRLQTIGEQPPLVVGVTVNLTALEIRSLVERSEMDVVQLSGNEPPALLDSIDIPAIKTIHVGPDSTMDALRQQADQWLDHQNAAWALLIDATVPGQFGGTGVRADWPMAARLAEEYPVLLAGGLTPGNVAEGISSVHPMGVDVASGVEVAGVKDHALIGSFVARARQAFADGPV